MIINNYSDLSKQVRNVLAREDLLPFVDGFIQQCENKLYRRLNLRHEETAFSIAVSNGVAPVPADFKAWLHGYFDQSPIRPLDWVPPTSLYDKYPVRSGGNVPCVVSREAGNFIFGPFPQDGTIQGVYYAKTPSARVTGTNWYVENAPEVLLYGALLEATPFIRNDERLPVWNQFYQDAYQSLEDEYAASKHSMGPIRQIPG